MINVGIVGANGYTGFELLRLLRGHSRARVAFIGSRSNAGMTVGSIYPSLGLSYGDIKFDDIDLNECAKRCDVVFTALPHAAAAETIAKLHALGVRVIDLSADFRYDDLDLYEKTYKVTHPCKELNTKAVYGLSEINRKKIKSAQIVGNPGCYTTCSILPLYPLLQQKLISSDGIIIDAKSGVSGAGRKADVNFSFCEVDENFLAYAVSTHRHTSEIEEKLTKACGQKERIKLSFTPHLLPIKRGILATIYANPINGASEASLTKALSDFYKDECFVKVIKDGTLPQLNWVVNSNVCAIGLKLDERLNRVIIVSCLDNLIKGASGQAIQNMNIMFDFDENDGLLTLASHI